MSHADGFLVLYAVNSIDSFWEALEFPDMIYRVKGVKDIWIRSVIGSDISVIEELKEEEHRKDR
jgi:hypothetical protein